MAAFIFDAGGIVKRYLTEIGSVWVQSLADLHRERLANGLSRSTLISADQELNAAAVAEGMDVDDPMAHP
jgi:hypothetical protein